MNWLGKPKFSSTMFHGTSPEFDFALLTVCFVSRYNNPGCAISLNGKVGEVIVWTMTGVNPTTVGSAYPTC